MCGGEGEGNIGISEAISDGDVASRGEATCSPTTGEKVVAAAAWTLSGAGTGEGDGRGAEHDVGCVEVEVEVGAGIAAGAGNGSGGGDAAPVDVSAADDDIGTCEGVGMVRTEVNADADADVLDPAASNDEEDDDDAPRSGGDSPDENAAVDAPPMDFCDAGLGRATGEVVPWVTPTPPTGGTAEAWYSVRCIRFRACNSWGDAFTSEARNNASSSWESPKCRAG